MLAGPSNGRKVTHSVSSETHIITQTTVSNMLVTGAQRVMYMRTVKSARDKRHAGEHHGNADPEQRLAQGEKRESQNAGRRQARAARPEKRIDAVIEHFGIGDNGRRVGRFGQQCSLALDDG